MKRKNTASSDTIDTTRYETLVAWIRNEIRGGRWKENTVIPSRRTLAQQHGMSVNTVNHAIGMLVREGLLVTRNRMGTQVAESFTIPEVPVLSPRPMVKPNAASVTVGILVHDNETPMADADWRTAACRTLEKTLSEYSVGSAHIPVRGNAGRNLQDALARAGAMNVQALAVIYFTTDWKWENVLTPFFMAHPLPMMLITTAQLDTPIPHTYVDEAASGYLVAHHLVTLGYRRFNWIGAFKQLSWASERLRGFQRGIARTAHQLSMPCDGGNIKCFAPNPSVTWEQWMSGSPKSNRRRVEEQVGLALARSGAEPNNPIAFIGVNDDVAIMVAEVLKKRGIKPGRDAGVVGFDDGTETAIHNITSVRPPLRDMASTAARLLVEGVVGGKPLPTRVGLHGSLILRQSTQRE